MGPRRPADNQDLLTIIRSLPAEHPPAEGRVSSADHLMTDYPINWPPAETLRLAQPIRPL